MLAWEVHVDARWRDGIRKKWPDPTAGIVIDNLLTN
jgi:hypothetical protein